MTDPLVLDKTITKQDKELLVLLSEGYTSAEIGQMMYLSRSRIDKISWQLYDKLDVPKLNHNRRTVGVVTALRKGIIK